MAELTKFQEKIIKTVQIVSPIGGAIAGFMLIGGGFGGQLYGGTSTTRKIVGLLIGTAIGFGVAYLSKKKIETEN